MKRPVLRLAVLAFLFFSASPLAAEPKAKARLVPLPSFPPCGPVTEAAFDVNRAGNPEAKFPLPQLDFCSRWNPEFGANGHHCCGKLGFSTRLNRKIRCAKERRRGEYCSEMTPEQLEYTRLAEEGKLGDVLELITRDLGRRGEQAYCTVNNGFLAWGRRIVPSPKNRIRIRSPGRCTDFGTDGMIGMIEWLGREVGTRHSEPERSGVRLLVGDISAPRGGCLSGRGGRRGHLSHTTGQDVDLGFVTVRKGGGESPANFHKSFDTKENWWLIRKIFENPFACVKVAFLDKRHIRKLTRDLRKSKDAGELQAWERLSRFVRHMPGHANHLHIRIGDYPGQPGCVADARPELETEDSTDEFDSIEGITGSDSEASDDSAKSEE